VEPPKLLRDLSDGRVFHADAVWKDADGQASIALLDPLERDTHSVQEIPDGVVLG
jgi:hypothetical protein